MFVTIFQIRLPYCTSRIISQLVQFSQLQYVSNPSQYSILWYIGTLYITHHIPPSWTGLLLFLLLSDLYYVFSINPQTVISMWRQHNGRFRSYRQPGLSGSVSSKHQVCVENHSKYTLYISYSVLHLSAICILPQGLFTLFMSGTMY